MTPDPEVAAAVAGFERLLNSEMDVPLGTTAVELDSRVATVRGHEAAIGNLIADAMRARGHADVAIMNGGGIRAGKIYPPGSPVTRRDVLAELPFGNHLVVVAVKGSDLRAAIENGLSRLPAIAGRFPQVSGMRVEYDPQRPAGSRVVSIAVGGAPLDPDRMYKVATNDFMARGGDGYTSLAHNKPAVPPDDSPRLSNEVMVYLREARRRADRHRRTDARPIVVRPMQTPPRKPRRRLTQIRRRSAARTQVHPGDAGGDAESGLRLAAQRLQRDGVVGPADQRIGADADADRGARRSAAIGAGEVAALDAAGRRKHRPRHRDLLREADVDAGAADAWRGRAPAGCCPRHGKRSSAR